MALSAKKRKELERDGRFDLARRMLRNNPFSIASVGGGKFVALVVCDGEIRDVSHLVHAVSGRGRLCSDGNLSIANAYPSCEDFLLNGLEAELGFRPGRTDPVAGLMSDVEIGLRRIEGTNGDGSDAEGKIAAIRKALHAMRSVVENLAGSGLSAHQRLEALSLFSGLDA